MEPEELRLDAAETLGDVAETPRTGGDEQDEFRVVRPTFISAADLIDAPRPAEIIEGIAWAGCVTVLVSESGTGKTFVLLSQAAAVSAGVPWHGRAVRRGSVAYLSWEGDALGLRLRALRDAQDARLDNVYVLRATDPLSPIVDRDRIESPSQGERDAVDEIDAKSADLVRFGRPPIVLLVVDTARASLSGSEDSSEHVAAYMRATRRLLTHAPGAGAILAHHAGWQDGETKRKRERGSSAFRGNCDATLFLEAGDYDAVRGEAHLTLSALKIRDAERPAPLHLLRRRVELAEAAADDLRRGPLTSCVIEPDGRTHEDREAEQTHAAAAAQQKLDLSVLRTMRDQSVTSGAALRERLGIRHGTVVETLARFLQARWITKAGQRHPYVLTDAGRALLLETEP